MPTKAAQLIKIFGSIGSPGRFEKGDFIDVAQFSTAFTAAEASTEDDTIEVHVKSDGGRVDSGNAFISAMQASKKNVVAIIYAAYSMGYFLCLGAHKIKAYRNSMIMLHSVQGSVQGSPDEMRAEAEILDKFNKTISPLLALRTGLTEEEVTALYLGKAVYLTAQEALAAKLIDEIIDADAEGVPVVTASMSYEQVRGAFRTASAGNEEENFLDKISRHVARFLNIKDDVAPAAAINLSSDEEWRISCLISSCRDICDFAESLVENSSNPAVVSAGKELVAISSKYIIQLVTMLYGEEETDMASASVKKKIGDAVAVVQAKHAAHLKGLIAADVTAKMDVLNTQVTEANAKLTNAQNDLTAKDTQISQLTARLAGKPADDKRPKGTGAEGAQANNEFVEKTSKLAHNQEADELLASYGIGATGKKVDAVKQD